MNFCSRFLRLSVVPRCRERPQTAMCFLEWLGRLKWRATGLDASLSFFSTSRRCSRNRSPSRQNDPETGRIFSQPPLISFKRDKNVGNFLVRSALKTNEQPGTFKCARSRCNTCRFIVNTSKISGPKRSVKITDRFTCTSANVIYCITCTLCNKLYIGETGRRLGDRFREHLRDVEKNDKDASKPVARHFNLPNHSKKHMAVCGLSLHLGTTESRKNLEQKFIFQIGTLNPHGINERFSFN